MSLLFFIFAVYYNQFIFVFRKYSSNFHIISIIVYNGEEIYEMHRWLLMNHSYD